MQEGYHASNRTSVTFFTVLRRVKAHSLLAARNVALWPLTSFTALQKCGRYRTNSGQTAPSGLTGSAAFDPTETSPAKFAVMHNTALNQPCGRV
jgi:hypothetical protein